MNMEEPKVEFVPIQMINTEVTSGASESKCKYNDSDEDCGGPGQPTNFNY